MDSPGMSTPDLNQTRAVLEGLRAGRGGRVSAEIRREILVAVEAAHDGGLSYDRIAEALSIPSKLLGRWRRREKHRRRGQQSTASTSGAEFAAVRVPLPAAEVVVYGPGGLRIEGLSVDALAELFRRLA